MPPIRIRKMTEMDLGEADRVTRLAFGTFLKLPDPMTFMGETDYIRTRWRADPDATFVALSGDELVGSVFVTNWGSVGFFGPLTVRPDYWDQGVARLLMEPVLECFSGWKTRHAGLFTFSTSPKHLGLYQRYGFWPRFLTAILSRPVSGAGEKPHYALLSESRKEESNKTITACRQLTEKILEGLDLRREIEAVRDQLLGETVLIFEKNELAAFAVCHFGPGTEAGKDICYIKFAAVSPSADAPKYFDRLIRACCSLAEKKNLSRLTAGVNLSRQEAYHQLLEMGFRIDTLGVAMQRPNEAGYNHPGIFLLDDWR